MCKGTVVNACKLNYAYFLTLSIVRYTLKTINVVSACPVGFFLQIRTAQCWKHGRRPFKTARNV